MSGLVTNPAFDKRIYNVMGLQKSIKGSGLTRGRILQVDADGSHTRYGCNFLYNPSAIQASHSIDTSVVPVSDPNDLSKLIVPLQQSVNFSLLFDRTYETWDSKYNAETVGQYGVHADVLALYNIVGITISLAALGEASGDDGAQGLTTRGTKVNVTPVSPMVYTPVRVFFGGPLKYYGVITSLGITYSHWTQNMIPSRCSADITLSLLPDNGTRDQTFATYDRNLDLQRRYGTTVPRNVQIMNDADMRRSGR